MRGDEPSATYVYCIVRSARAPRLVKAPKGLAGTSKPRLLDAGDGLHLVVSTAPLSRYDGAVIDEKLRDLDWVGARASEHEAIVEHALELGTVVPMKLFTLFSSDERALAHVKKIRRSLERITDRIAGCEEWGLRILFDDARAARAAAETARAASVVSGKDFLLRKKALGDERRSAGARGTEAANALFDELSALARSARRRPAPNRELAGRVLLDAVFLFPRAAVRRVKKAVAATAEAIIEEGCDVTLTGPWPAYSFIGEP